MKKTLSFAFVLTMAMVVGCAHRTPAPSVVQESTNAVLKPAGKPDETDIWVQAYFKFNKISPQPLYVGMKVEDVIAVLGEPTERLSNPQDRSSEQLHWYHNPKGMHVAPFITCETQDGVVKGVWASRR